MRRLVLVCAVLAACHRPPPAPEGLDAATRYLVREFWSDDETVGAGLTGLMDWFDAEGWALLDQRATTDTVAGFEVAPLHDEDVAALGLPDDGRDLSRAFGIIALSTLDCAWPDAEATLARPDQAAVFPDQFDAYDRTYRSDRDAYQAASRADDLPPVDAPTTDPSDVAALDPAAWLVTHNVAQTGDLGIHFTYPLELDLRHGAFSVQGTPTDVFLVESWIPEAVSSGDGSGGNEIAQSYVMEADLDRGEQTLRVFAIWNEIHSPLIPDHSPIWSTSGVNKAEASSERLSDVCSGAVSVP